jgi:hypothetical protein
MLVRTPPKSPEPKIAARRAAIAFTLVGLDAAAPECHRQGEHSCYEPTAA